MTTVEFIEKIQDLRTEFAAAKVRTGHCFDHEEQRDEARVELKHEIAETLDQWIKELE